MTAASFHPGSERSPSILIGVWIFGSDSVGGTGSSCSAAKRRGAHSTARRTTVRNRIERSLRGPPSKVTAGGRRREAGDVTRSRLPPATCLLLPEIVARHPLELRDRPEALRAHRHR